MEKNELQIFFEDKRQKKELKIDCQENDLKNKKINNEHERIKSIKYTLKTFY